MFSPIAPLAAWTCGWEFFRQVQEAAAFSEKAAAIKGPYQQQAWTNAHLMKQEAEKMRGAR